MRYLPSAPHTLREWYMLYRREHKPKVALWHARLSYKAEADVLVRLNNLSPATYKRIDAFVDDFIRGEMVEGLTSDRDQDFINEPERADRCYTAAHSGADGKTHSEVIQDWNDAFSQWLDERAHSGCDSFNRGESIR